MPAGRRGSPASRVRFPGMTDYTFRSRNVDGTLNEVAITPEQALDLAGGRAIAYFPHDERITVDEDGTIIYHQDARPRHRDS